MKNFQENSQQLVTEAYREYKQPVFLYLYKKLGNKEEAEDMVQEAFLRLLDYSRMLRKDTVRCFLFTIAKNLVMDYLRRYYRRQEMLSFLMEEGAGSVSDVESKVIAAELQGLEIMKVQALPPCRKQAYVMSRFEDKTADDIALALNISKRTAERHIFMGRKEVREYIRQCI
ncbi:sigma-70 family RNA polymerase sigma factor [uncultured Bacteroides sp.]|jgi:RNA polymerase sigma factor, sigma-70 family|uniref:RNA polymerase sigma factor n=1 Tax=uncultured Bacteroides sp. TaxID=162156 RepID=UPI00280B811C|nr:sigma-70 family RNA polymerase sigma factor [uncultured Bacteroides sp.]